YYCRRRENFNCEPIFTHNMGKTVQTQTMLKNLVAILIFTLALTSVAAQRSGEVKGILQNTDKEPLPFATATIYNAADTALIDYVLTEDDGSFSFRRLPFDQPMRIIISFLGYEPVRQDFELNSANPSMDFGVIEMVTSSQTLDEILVLAERPPIVMKDDTLEFNAGSFFTRDGATVEDLIKKLPGV